MTGFREDSKQQKLFYSRKPTLNEMLAHVKEAGEMLMRRVEMEGGVVETVRLDVWSEYDANGIEIVVDYKRPFNTHELQTRAAADIRLKEERRKKYEELKAEFGDVQ